MTWSTCGFETLHQKSLSKNQSNSNQPRSGMKGEGVYSKQLDINLFLSPYIYSWGIAFPFPNNFWDQDERKPHTCNFHVLIWKLSMTPRLLEVIIRLRLHPTLSLASPPRPWRQTTAVTISRSVDVRLVGLVSLHCPNLLTGIISLLNTRKIINRIWFSTDNGKY